MALEFTTSYLADARSLFRYYQQLAERAMAQVTDAQLYELLDAESNSIAVVVKHVAGNLKSRWRDFLTTDGEKPDRDRDAEFSDPPPTRAALMTVWNDGWNTLWSTLDALADADLERTVMIRGEQHSVMQAINRALSHNAYHVGQIVLLAKHFQSARWTSLTIPRGASRDFNRAVAAGEKSQR